ncbi:hypothetical protein PJF56_13635 [Roseofilum sp. BLCC_M91]|uniref:DUF3368 domain-containing protein n=1 Tax=Roseofilum halophilum BLCC-M91 TaxID=3022259 RepID=A0ABT7BL39_9CYAN|nr:hypothetical protein [Roseofilum halophilum]MDJ1179908.1 hypothetical protein [Roseofilum halophilum BLCC-M91]
MIVVSDTSVITNLAAIAHLDLLPQLYSPIIIPEAVYRELADIDPPIAPISVIPKADNSIEWIG